MACRSPIRVLSAVPYHFQPGSTTCPADDFNPFPACQHSRSTGHSGYESALPLLNNMTATDINERGHNHFRHSGDHYSYACSQVAAPTCNFKEHRSCISGSPVYSYAGATRKNFAKRIVH